VLAAQSGGADDYADGMAPHPPFAWHEKIAVLLLAAHLEASDDGWHTVRISVPPKVVKGGGVVPDQPAPSGGWDWARLVEVVARRGRPYSTADLEAKLARQDYLALAEARPAWTPDKLAPFLRSAVESEAESGGDAYRLDGIWHDNGGDFDLVAWGIGKTLIVEAKGITSGRSNAPRAVAEALGKIALNIRSGPGYRYGILVPGDEGSFLSVLARPDPANPLLDGLPVTIFSVHRNGEVATWDRPTTPAERLGVVTPGG
jgi:hypothetical protein